jgi:hypothetical protein
MVLDCVRDVREKIEKLVLIVGRPGSGKSKLMRGLADIRGWKYLDCDTLITDELLELVPRVRAQEAPRIMDEVMKRMESEVYLIDGMQVLFTPLLQLDPLPLLRHLSRKHTIVAAWPGTYQEGNLLFEYNSGLMNNRRQYSADELTIIQL